jgi:hypothetical protein
MITIEQNQILRDGELIGSIDGNKAYLLKKQGGVIIGQIKKAAGIELDFDVVAELPTDKESLTVEPISDDVPQVKKREDIGAFIEFMREDDANHTSSISAAGLLSFPGASEPEPVSDVAGSGTTFDTSSFDCTYEQNPKLFAQCFVNTYGAHGYSEWLKLNGK